jgi:hypothetical protein
LCCSKKLSALTNAAYKEEKMSHLPVRRVIAGLVAGVAVAATSTTAFAADVHTEHSVVPVEYTAITCLGTAVQMTGTSRINAVAVETDGARHVVVRTFLDASGIDPATGRRFDVHETSTSEDTFSLSGPSQLTQISKGFGRYQGNQAAGDDFRSSSVFHVTFSVEGEWHVIVVKQRFECA